MILCFKHIISNTWDSTVECWAWPQSWSILTWRNIPCGTNHTQVYLTMPLRRPPAADRAAPRLKPRTKPGCSAASSPASAPSTYPSCPPHREGKTLHIYPLKVTHWQRQEEGNWLRILGETCDGISFFLPWSASSCWTSTLCSGSSGRPRSRRKHLLHSGKPL